MDKDTQIKKMIKMMKSRKVLNYEFPRMYILNHTARISDIRAMGITVSKERIYDEQGKATGKFMYWIPRNTKKPAAKAMEYETLDEPKKKSNFLNRRVKLL